MSRPPLGTVTTSVVTLVRNRTSHLVELAEGLCAGTAVPDELVVVVMGGDDPAPAIRRDGVPIRFVRCDPTASTLPLARARNVGARQARGRHLVFLDVDCIPGSRTMERYVVALEQTDALFTGPVRYLEPGAARPGWTEAGLRERSRPHPARPAPRTGGVVVTEDYEHFWSLSFALRRETFLGTIGGFDEGMDGYGGEDTDFAFRARAAGVPLAWVTDAVAFHQHHESFAPPLPHLRSIVANARRFRTRWGRWPMEGWLSEFAARGLVTWDPDADVLEIIRLPTDAEIEAARRDQVVSDA